MGPMGVHQIFVGGGRADRRHDDQDARHRPPAFWLYYFDVEAIDAAAARHQGGRARPSRSASGARRRLDRPCRDPQGACLRRVGPKRSAAVIGLVGVSPSARPVSRGVFPNATDQGDDAVIVKQIWTANAYRNFNYLIACDETGEALAIDPLDHEKCLKAAKDEGWNITQILNTHEHRDHTGGNEAMVRKTGARILAHKNARDKIADMARGLGAGDIVKVGKTVELEVLDTPGHTMSHVCLLSQPTSRHSSAGIRCSMPAPGIATMAVIRQSSTRRFPSSSPSCPRRHLIYPGHDYIENNLRFTLNREPDNKSAREMLDKLAGQDPNSAYVSTLEVERQINTFFRLTSPTVIAKLREAFPDLPEKPDQRTVFLKLRELRNTW